MPIKEKDIKRVSAILLIVFLAVLSFLVIRPIWLAIFAGLILAYIFSPVYKRVLRLVKKPDLAASIVCALLLLVIIVPLWYFVPLAVQQILNLSRYSQEVDARTIVLKLLPGASEQLASQISLAINSTLSKLNLAVLNYLVDFLVNFADLLLRLLIV